MNLETIFYTLGIIFMSLSILILIVIGAVLLVIKQKVTKLTKTVEEKIDLVSNAISDPSGIAFKIGSTVADRAVNKLKDIIKK